MNAIWRLSAEHGIAYVEDRRQALSLIHSDLVEGRTLGDAMAVYTTPRGRTFAWQILFPCERWSAVARTLAITGEAARQPPNPAAEAPAPDPVPPSTSEKKPARAAAATTRRPRRATAPAEGATTASAVGRKRAASAPPTPAAKRRAKRAPASDAPPLAAAPASDVPSGPDPLPAKQQRAATAKPRTPAGKGRSRKGG
ncbi:MAG: hypothetical protein GX774_20495 [Armatimonadetes bacterium]|jgi:hypothetical protein|nr:hypothetical protein [Armatimonadota bacterium]